MKGTVKIVTIGGGSSYTPELMKVSSNDMKNFQLEKSGWSILKMEKKK